jgi:hypothetical protein
MKIITGMHRSGTSAVARLFFEAGADMGEKKDFYPPDRWNPDGYFEQPDIHAVNFPLINGPWGKLAYLKLPSENTVAKRARERSRQIAETAEKYKEKWVKETRFCLTLDAWQTHGAAIEKILVCLREPIQTAESLKRRNKIPIWLALNLWEEHYRRLLSQARSLPLRFIDYNDLLNPDTAPEEILPAFKFMDCPVTEGRARLILADGLKPELKHHAAGSFPYPAKIRDLWRELRNRHRSQFTVTAS